MLSTHNNIDFVFGLETVMEYGQKTIRIRRQVHTDDSWFFGNNVAEKSGVLMGETIVILSPDMTGEQNVKTWKIVSPADITACLHPLDMLIEHTGDDVNKSFIRVYQSMATSQEVTFEPPLALVLT